MSLLGSRLEHGTAEYETEFNLYFKRDHPLKITPTK
jgi:hypothetical protein